MIKDDEVQIGTVSSAYNNTATASQKMMSQTATGAWQDGNDDFEQDILASSLQKDFQ